MVGSTHTSVERVKATQTSLYTSPRALVQRCGLLGVKLLAQGCVHVFLLLVLPAWHQNRGLRCHVSPGDRKDNGTVLSLTTSPALNRSFVKSSMGRETHCFSSHFLSQQWGWPSFQCLLAHGISFDIRCPFFSHTACFCLIDSYGFLSCVVLILSFIYCR